MFRDHMFDGEHFFRGPRRRSSLQKGDLKYLVLDLIKDKPRHGYEIIRELEELSYGTYKPSPGVVYPTLQMLEDMGYASVQEQEGKKVYSITAEGEEFLSKQKDQANGVRDHVKSKWSFKNLGKMAMVMAEYHAMESLIGRGFRAMDAEKAQMIREVLIKANRDIRDILEQ